jgi:hypothetical protein
MSIRKRLGGLGTIVVLAGLLPITNVSALTIERDFIGGTPQPNALGGGNLVDIFNAAADRWESAIRDQFTVTFQFGWAPIGGGTHTLNAQGGTPNRETAGTILINNDTIPGHFRWFLDPTPRLNEEWGSFTTSFADLGGGTINVGRTFSDPVGAAVGEIDLYTDVLHEIGHGLGMSLANNSFITESADGSVDVTAPRPFAGTKVPLAHNLAGIDSHPDLNDPRFSETVMVGGHFGERKDLSALDILLMAQLSEFTDVSLDPVPEPTTLFLWGTTMAGLGIGVRWRGRK